MNERIAWITLVLVAAGWAAGETIAETLGARPLGFALAGLGAIAGYGASRVVADRLRPRRRGTIKYWRGQRFEE